MELFEKRESLFDVIISFPVSFRLLKIKLHRTCARIKPEQTNIDSIFSTFSMVSIYGNSRTLEIYSSR